MTPTRRTHLIAAALSLTMILIASTSLSAQDQKPPIRALTFAMPPFVMKQGDQLTGFSIDLWNEVAARMNVKTTYREESNAAVAVEVSRAKDFDVAVAGIYYTTERDKEFDFSLPIMEPGLQVLVRDTTAHRTSSPLNDVLTLVFSRSAAMWLGVVLVIILLPAHVIWLLDRGNEDSVSISKKYFPGIFHALVWAATGLVSQTQQLPGRWVARVFGLLWMFVGVVFIALYTAQLTATLTVEQIQGTINGPGDLPGKRTAVLANSTATDYLRGIKAEVVECQTADEVFAALLDQRADAVLASSPVVRYYAAHGGAGRVRAVGPEFNKQDMGFVVQLNSPLRRKIDSALIAIHEDGTYQRIYEKYFGSE